MSTISRKTVKLLIQTGEPLDLSKLAKKESMDNVQRWIVSISHTVKMIDFHQQEYKLLHERHLTGTSSTHITNNYSTNIHYLVQQRWQARIRKLSYGRLLNA